MEEKHETDKKRTKPFNSFSALAKATTRVQRAIEQALPKTPNRREAVQRELFHQSAIQNKMLLLISLLKGRSLFTHF